MISDTRITETYATLFFTTFGYVVALGEQQTLDISTMSRLYEPFFCLSPSDCRLFSTTSEIDTNTDTSRASNISQRRYTYSKIRHCIIRPTRTKPDTHNNSYFCFLSLLFTTSNSCLRLFFSFERHLLLPPLHLSERASERA
jgi:hypothetical protein